jgi:channel protein (hemolysin III family)
MTITAGYTPKLKVCSELQTPSKQCWFLSTINEQRADLTCLKVIPTFGTIATEIDGCPRGPKYSKRRFEASERSKLQTSWSSENRMTHTRGGDVAQWIAQCWIIHQNFAEETYRLDSPTSPSKTYNPFLLSRQPAIVDHRETRLERKAVKDIGKDDHKNVTEIEGAEQCFDADLKKRSEVEDGLRGAIKRALNLARENGTIFFEDLPLPWRFNPYIISGYRFTDSTVDCLHSAFRTSNEFFNIWSHAIGLLLMLGLGISAYQRVLQENPSDAWMTIAFFTAACVLMLCSVTYHTMGCSASTAHMVSFCSVDMMGITIFITISAMWIEHAALCCEPVLRMFFLCATGVYGASGVFLAWYPPFTKPSSAWLRVVFFTLLGVTGVIPGLYLAWAENSSFASHLYSLMIKPTAPTIIGSIFYAGQIPERWWPGKFDFIGSSHNIWHMAVLTSILYEFPAFQEFSEVVSLRQCH